MKENNECMMRNYFWKFNGFPGWNRTRVLVYWGLALVLGFNISFISIQNKPKAFQPYKIGDKIKDFGLTNYDGNTIRLSYFIKDKGVILIFMRNTCEYCEAYEGRIMDLDKKYRKLGYKVWAISPFGDNPKDHPLDDIPHMRAKALHMGYTFPYCTDRNFEITNIFGDQYTPMVYILVRKKADFYLEFIGDIDNDWTGQKAKKIKYVEKFVDSALHLPLPKY